MHRYSGYARLRDRLAAAKHFAFALCVCVHVYVCMCVYVCVHARVCANVRIIM